MTMWKLRHVLRSPDDQGGGGAAPAPAPAAPAPVPAAPAPGPAAPAPSPAAPAPAPADTKGFWPDNWRETVSKEDAKRLGQLQRYASPQAAIEALFAAQDRIRSGELKPVLGKNPSADDLKEWRDAHGIPEKPEAYDLGKDFKVDPSDEGLITALKTAGHKSHQTADQIRATVGVLQQLTQQARDARAAADTTFKQDGEDKMRAEWGGEFRRNVNLVHGLLDLSGSQDLKAQMLDARLPDGRRIGDSPEAMKMLLGVALIQNPTGVVVPGGDANRAETVDTEIEKIEKRMREDRKGYNKDEKMQAQYRDLLDARERMKPKR
jgi:hypothetical protein